LKELPVIKRILSHACVYFTVGSLGLYTLGMLFSGIEREWIPTLKMMYMVLVFSVLFASVNEIVRHPTLPGVLKTLIHYAATTVIFAVVFIVWGGFSGTPSSVLVILLAYTLVYAIFALIFYLIHNVFAIRKSNSSAYTSLFADKSEKK